MRTNNRPYKVIYASYLRRLVAGIIDLIFVGLFPKAAKLFSPPMPITSLSNPLPTEELTKSYIDVINTRADFHYQLLIFSFSLIPMILISFLISKYGFSPGKKIVGIKVQRKNGERLSFGRAFLREFTKGISAIPFGLGYFWIFIDKEKQAWHDKFADSLVVNA